MRRPLRIGIALITFGITVTLGFNLYRDIRNTSEYAAEQFVQSLGAGDTQKSKTFLGSSVEFLQDSQLQQMVGLQPNRQSVEELPNTFHAYDAQAAPRRFTYIFDKDRESSTITFVMVKQRTSWKIVTIQMWP